MFGNQNSFRMAKKLVFITAHSKGQDMASFEKTTKEQYLTGPAEKRPCLTFFHHHASDTDIAVKVKSKKPEMLIFDRVSEARIITVKKAVNKKMNGSSPEMVQTGTAALIPGVRQISHEKILEMIQN